MDTEKQIQQLQLQMEKLEGKIEAMNENDLDKNDLFEFLESQLAEKDYVSKTEMEKILHEFKIKLLKWKIATGISLLALVVGIARLFLM